jgi:hypothetical protein
MAVAALVSPDITNPSSFASPLWVPVNVMFGMGALLGLFGLIVIYNRVAADGLALLGFVLSFSGTAVFVGAALAFQAFVLPAIGASSAAKTLLDPNGPLMSMSSPLTLIFLITGAGFAVGFILLAVAIWRTKSLPPWGGVLGAVGAPLLAFTPPLPSIALNVGGVLFGVGVAWLGYAIWSKK